MDNLSVVSEGVLVGTIFVGILILTLGIALFLFDRKRELGIYMVLGERKKRIINQIILEVIVVFIFAMICSFIVGNILSNVISSRMVEQDLIHQMRMREEEPFDFIDIDVSEELSFFNPGSMSFDEMIEAFDTSLNMSTILLIFVVGGGVVFLSTVAPIIYLVRLEPKEILTISQGN